MLSINSHVSNDVFVIRQSDIYGVVLFPKGTIIALPGPRLNIKTVLSTYGDFHVKDKTAVRTSYL